MIADFYRGDSKTITVRIGSTVYLDGVAWLTLKTDRELEDEDAVLQKTANIIVDPEDAEKNIAVFSLAPTDTDLEVRKYYYDVQAVSSDESIVTTLLSGTVKVLRDTTRLTHVG